jgi:hypothetical protein
MDQVVIVEDEDEWSRRGGDVVDQAREERLWRGRLGSLQHSLGGLADFGINPLQGCHEIGEEARRVVVVFVEGEPGDWGRGAGVQRCRGAGLLLCSSAQW